MRTFAPRRSLLVAALVSCTLPVMAQQAPDTQSLQGVYESIPAGTALPGGLRNAGAPASIALLPEAARRTKTVDLKKDPWKMCQPVGPFRMMAAERTKIELVPSSAMIVMLFEDLSHGMMRPIYLKRGHPPAVKPTWLGDSIGRWEGDTLVVDTIGFNDSTWLNEQGAQHTEALHLVERIRQMPGGQFLEYKMTADDPGSLAKPYSYTRYYKRLDTEIADDPCQDEP